MENGIRERRRNEILKAAIEEFSRCGFDATRIDAAFPGADTWFPDLDADGAWERTEESGPLEQDGIVYRYVTYRRRA